MVRRIIAGAYRVNAVYFFRNVDFQDTITLNPVDIVCALRPPLRRISLLHLILQNGRQLPRPLLQKLYDAIDDYNHIKQREDQRPRWGIHLSEAHILAIADTPTPADRERANQPLANRKQPRKLHQHWEECRKRKHHRQRHGEQLKPLLRQNKLQ